VLTLNVNVSKCHSTRISRFELALLLPPPSSRPSVILPQPEVSRGLKDHPPVHISDKAYVAPTPETSSPVKRDSLERPRPPFHQQVDTPMSPSEMAGTPDSNGSGDSNASTRKSILLRHLWHIAYADLFIIQPSKRLMNSCLTRNT
jgi:hypothetical protein